MRLCSIPFLPFDTNYTFVFFPDGVSTLRIAIVETFQVDSFETSTPLLQCKTEKTEAGSPSAQSVDEGCSCSAVAPTGAAAAATSASSASPAGQLGAESYHGDVPLDGPSSTAAASKPRIAAKKAFQVDTFGPRSSLLRCKAEEEQTEAEREQMEAEQKQTEAEEEQTEDEVQAAPPVAASRAAEGGGGWCIRKGCLRSFASWEDFYEHFCERHRPVYIKQPWQTCHLCLQTLKKESTARWHAKDHSQAGTKFQCKRCSACYVKQSKLAKHMAEFHRM